MRQLAFKSLFLMAICTVFACKNADTTAKNTPSVNATEKAVSQQFHKHLRGKIGDFPVTMDIVQNLVNSYEVTLSIGGYYSYDNYQQPIAIYGTVESDGSWKLEETARDNTASQFVGKFANGVFSGIWSDTTRKKSYPFSLTEDYSDGAQQFDYQSFVDSVPLVKGEPKSPIATFELDALLPKNTEGVGGYLTKAIQQFYSADTFGQVGVNALPIEQSKLKRRDAFFKDYQESNAEMLKDSADWQAAMNNWVMNYGMEVIHNAADKVSVAYTNYWYSGGAHGNYGSSLATYDLKNQKQIQLTDIFKPNYKPVVNAALARAVRKNFALKPKAPLSEVLFENSIEANDNFCITPKGILFNYVPYEISAYAVGEIQLFVPFEEIKSVLK